MKRRQVEIDRNASRVAPEAIKRRSVKIRQDGNINIKYINKSIDLPARDEWTAIRGGNQGQRVRTRLRTLAPWPAEMREQRTPALPPPITNRSKCFRAAMGSPLEVHKNE